MTKEMQSIIWSKKQRKSPKIVRFQDFSGGDKRDRTADLMTASCDRFVILSVFTSNPSVPSAKSAGFYSDLSTASTCFHAHLGHNPGQKIQSTQTVVRILIKLILGFVIRSKAIDQISKEYRGSFHFPRCLPLKANRFPRFLHRTKG